MKGYHTRRIKKGDECFDKSAAEILEIMQGRASQSPQRVDVPKLMWTPEGNQQAIYWKGMSKWCPPLPSGSKWTLEQDPLPG